VAALTDRSASQAHTDNNRRTVSAEASGQGRPQSVEQLTRETGDALARFGVNWSRSKVSRVVRTYLHQVAPNGFPFDRYVLNKVTVHVQRQAELADELRKVVSYADPTGETAAGNVDRSRQVVTYV